MAKEKLELVEVSPRDGLQNEPEVVATATKLELINRIIAAGQEKDVTVQLVHLTCERSVLFQRVQEESRKAYGKMTAPAKLTKLFEQYDLESGFPDRPSITIDTTHTTAEETAREILSSRP